MTNEKTIKIMQNIKNHAERADDKELVNACDTAIEALEQQPCEDTISKQVVLDKIKEVCFSKDQKWVDFRVSQGSNGQRDFIINFIESLSSDQPKRKGKWIYELEDWNKWTCSECGFSKRTNVHVKLGFKFCPNCGARMVSE